MCSGCSLAAALHISRVHSGHTRTHCVENRIVGAAYFCFLCPAAEGICTDKSLFGIQHWGDALPPAPTISKPDEEFLALGLEFVESREDIKVTELNELFEKVCGSVGGC